MKFGMHPSYQKAGDNNLFKYPNMYLPFLTPNQFLFEFGFCVISKLSVNYHGQDKPVYHAQKGADGTSGTKVPASIDIDFGLRELEIVTKETVDPTKAINGVTGGSISQFTANRLASALGNLQGGAAAPGAAFTSGGVNRGR
jgi:hypothetical protein